MNSCHIVSTRWIDRLAELRNYSSHNDSLLHCVWLLIHWLITEMWTAVCHVGLHVVSKLPYATQWTHAMQRTHGLQRNQKNLSMQCKHTKNNARNRFYSLRLLCFSCVRALHTLQFLWSVLHDQHVLCPLRCIQQLGNRPLSPFS